MNLFTFVLYIKVDLMALQLGLRTLNHQEFSIDGQIVRFYPKTKTLKMEILQQLLQITKFMIYGLICGFFNCNK